MPKVTISIPKHVSKAAKKIANEMNISLDRLFTLAFYHYLGAYHGERLTEILDTIYKDEPSTIDLALLKLQSASLASEEW